MTVRFEFELSDKDAENLIDILRREHTRSMHEAGQCIAKDREKQADWFNRYSDYVDELRAKVSAGSTRVKSVV